MSPKTLLLLAASAAALSLPLVGYAQPYYGQSGGYQSQYGQPGYQSQYGQPRGDWYGRRARFRGYPEFRQIEAHIRGEINDGARDDLLAPEDVADFNQQLRAIQLREQQEYRSHGWNLPQDDRAAIRSQLDTLDSLVDQTRDEP